jgi:addiction module HigA family antidote
MIPRNRPPTSPGVLLREEYLLPLGMTQGELASRMGVPLQRVNLLVNGKRAVTADTAVRLSAVLNTSAEMWMNLQVARDLWFARKAFKAAAKGDTR